MCDWSFSRSIALLACEVASRSRATGFEGLFAIPVGDVWYMRRVWGRDPKSGRVYSQTLHLPKESAGFLSSFWRLFTVCIFVFFSFVANFRNLATQKKRADECNKGILNHILTKKKLKNRQI